MMTYLPLWAAGGGRSASKDRLSCLKKALMLSCLIAFGTTKTFGAFQCIYFYEWMKEFALCQDAAWQLYHFQRESADILPTRRSRDDYPEDNKWGSATNLLFILTGKEQTRKTLDGKVDCDGFGGDKRDRKEVLSSSLLIQEDSHQK